MASSFLPGQLLSARPLATQKQSAPQASVASFVNQNLQGFRQGAQATPAATAAPATSSLSSTSTVRLGQPQNGVQASAQRQMDSAMASSRRVAALQSAANKLKSPNVGQVSTQGMYSGNGNAAAGGRPAGKGQLTSTQGLVRLGNSLLRPDAAASFQAMNNALRQATGRSLGITEGFRSYQDQVKFYNLWKQGKGNPAAVPGTSNHGRGVAIDINGYGSTGSPQFQWLLRNAGQFGWSWATGKASGEPWHWEFVK